MELVNKSVLLIVPKFYGYEKAITDALKKFGANIYVIYENLEEISYYYRFFYVYKKKQRENECKKYYRQKLNEIKNVDVVLAIRAQSIPLSTLEYMRKKYGKRTRFYLYLWDSVKNSGEILNMVPFYDSVSTFDFEDANIYGWKYRPLFYITEYLKENKKDIDLLFQGAIHSERVNVLNILSRFARENRYKLNASLYSKAFVYFKRKYISRNAAYVDAKNKDIKFKTISLLDMYNLYSRSRIVIDYTHPDQTGYTMRTIECIGSRCKLVTNNKAILHADFYNPNNIYIYDTFEPNNIPIDFFEKEYIEINPEILERYSIGKWIYDILN